MKYGVSIYMIFVLIFLHPLQMLHAGCDDTVEEIKEVVDQDTKQKRVERFHEKMDGLKGVEWWQKAIIKRIWEKEAEKGLIEYTDYHVRKPGFLTATFLMLPITLWYAVEFKRAVVEVARARGLSHGDRYVIIPLKVLASTGTTSFWYLLILVISLLAGNPLEVMGLAVHEPLYEETDPSDLEDDEVIVIVKLESELYKKKDVLTWESGATMMDSAYIEKLRQKYPNKIKVLDLSRSSLTKIKLYWSDVKDVKKRQALKQVERMQQEIHVNLAVQKFVIENFHGKKIRIKKLIVNGHGYDPGTFSADSLSNIYHFGEFTKKFLYPLRNYVAKDLEIHSGICMLGATEKGRKGVREAARILASSGGFVKVNKVYGTAIAPVKPYATILNPAAGSLELHNLYISSMATADHEISQGRWPLGIFSGESVTYTFHVKPQKYTEDK